MVTFEEGIKKLTYIELVKKIAKYNEHIAKDEELLKSGKKDSYFGFSAKEIHNRIMDMQKKKMLCVNEIDRREQENENNK